jgi:WD40 repeat protein
VFSQNSRDLAICVNVDCGERLLMVGEPRGEKLRVSELEALRGIWLFDAKTGHRKRIIHVKNEDDLMHSLTFFPDGSKLASGIKGKLWNVKTGKLERQIFKSDKPNFTPISDPHKPYRFSANGTMLIQGRRGRVWSAFDGTPLNKFDFTPFEELTGSGNFINLWKFHEYDATSRKLVRKLFDDIKIKFKDPWGSRSLPRKGCEGAGNGMRVAWYKPNGEVRIWDIRGEREHLIMKERLKQK